MTRISYKALEGKSGAVLSGDVVGSSRLSFPQRNQLLATLRDAWAEVEGKWPEATLLPFEIYSGDAWQALVIRPALSLRIALFMRAYLKAHMRSVDTRIAIGIGLLEHFPSGRVTEAEGEAFRLSGRMLEEMKSKGKPRMRLLCSPCGKESGWEALAEVLDALIRLLWTPAKSRAVAGALQGLTQTEIAGLWPNHPIKQSVVSKHLATCGWDAIQAALDHFEQRWSIA